MPEQTSALLPCQPAPWPPHALNRPARAAGAAFDLGEASAAAHRPPARPAAALADSPTLAVKMLDGFHVWVGAEPLHTLPHGKARTLLKLLLLLRHRPDRKSVV